jgi:polar amino acid transport system permease protein
MWIYALPGLSNCWMLLIKSTALLSLLQIADIVLWAERLGSPNYTRTAGLVHPDWRWQYYLVLLVFYILLTFASEKVFAALTRWAARGMAVAKPA